MNYPRKSGTGTTFFGAGELADEDGGGVFARVFEANRVGVPKFEEGLEAQREVVREAPQIDTTRSGDGNQLGTRRETELLFAGDREEGAPVSHFDQEDAFS